ncbi:cytochrome C oxidase subunit IV family protein [Rubricoccus marinus]|uniref:Oxidase n=1 Tax=Rubricoccus marinus TaxID=716817 RepID=A0A259TZS4_9BACT|nr:cytochrome C oxidase subunit IV family protein [Rubricoccus marinus]OZC03231.1 hypothetical protein BSZ36_09740 [Rubricoccus marinus]
MAHAAHADGHDEHTGHGGHHVASPALLLRTIGILVGLTVLTVALGWMEQNGVIHLGAFSVPVALLIAGGKAYFVAAYFMGLKYDGGTNLLAFVGSIVFLVIFLTFTYLDTGFRDTFEEQSATPIDEIEAGILEATRESEALAPAFEAVPLVTEPDADLFPNAAGSADAGAAMDAANTPTENALPAVEADASANDVVVTD